MGTWGLARASVFLCAFLAGGTSATLAQVPHPTAATQRPAGEPGAAKPASSSPLVRTPQGPQPIDPPASGPQSQLMLRRKPIGTPAPAPSKPEIFFCDSPDVSCRTSADTFSIADLRDLFVFVTLPGVNGQHIETVQFLLPDGSLYLARQVKVTLLATPGTVPPMAMGVRADATPKVAPQVVPDGDTVHAEGVPSIISRSRNEQALMSVLPIGGTYITQRNLAGTWGVRIFLDELLVAQSSFTLRGKEESAAANEAGVRQ